MVSVLLFLRVGQDPGDEERGIGGTPGLDCFVASMPTCSGKPGHLLALSALSLPPYLVSAPPPLRNWTLGPCPPLLVHVSSSLYSSFSLCHAFPFWDPAKPPFPPAHPRACQHTFNWRTESQIIVSLKPGPAVATTVISPYLPSFIGNLHGKSPLPRLVEEWEGRSLCKLQAHPPPPLDSFHLVRGCP